MTAGAGQLRVREEPVEPSSHEARVRRHAQRTMGATPGPDLSVVDAADTMVTAVLYTPHTYGVDLEVTWYHPDNRQQSWALPLTAADLHHVSDPAAAVTQLVLDHGPHTLPLLPDLVWPHSGAGLTLHDAITTLRTALAVTDPP